MKSDEHMVKYTLQEIAKYFMPRQTGETVTNKIGDINQQFGTPSFFGDPQTYKDLSLPAGREFKIVVSGTYNWTIAPASGMQFYFTLNESGGKLKSKPFTAFEQTTSDSDKPFSMSLDLPKTNTEPITRIIITALPDGAGSYIALHNVIVSAVEVLDTTTKPVPTTVSGCLTTIADYIRSHSNMGGGSN